MRCRHSEESLSVITQDTMTIREIGEIFFQDFFVLFKGFSVTVTDFLPLTEVHWCVHCLCFGLDYVIFGYCKQLLLL